LARAEIAAEHNHLISINLEGSIICRETAKLRFQKTGTGL
jgi:hypothetical protein